MKARNYMKRICPLILTTVMALQPSITSWGNMPETEGRWKQVLNQWHFENALGEKQVGWIVSSGKWFYIDPETKAMKTGWQKIQDSWYFFDTTQGNNNGSMLTGWHWIDGYCYYFTKSNEGITGKLIVSASTIDGYRVNENGQWIDENGKAYFEKGKGLSSNPTENSSKKSEKTGIRRSGGSGRSGGSAGSIKEITDFQNQGSQNTLNQENPLIPENSSNHPSQEQQIEENNLEDILLDAHTKLINLGFSQYVTIVFAQGSVEDYDIYIDGTQVDEALSKITDDGSIVKWETTVVSPKQIRAVKLDSGKEEVLQLAEGVADSIPEPGSVDNDATYMLTNGKISIFDYQLDTYDENGAVRVKPGKTTFNLKPKREENINIAIPSNYYIPNVMIDENGVGTKPIIVKTSLKNSEQEKWFRQIQTIKCLSEENQILNANVTHSVEIEEGRYGKVGIITIPTQQTNMRRTGLYKLNFISSYSDTKVTVNLELVRNKEYKMVQSTESNNPKVGEDVLFTIKGVDNSSYGNEILSPITKVVLTKPSGQEVILKNMEDYSFISPSFHIYGNGTKTGKNINTNEIGIYKVEVFAKGYPKVTGRFEINPGRSFATTENNGIRGAEVSFVEEVEYDAVTSASLNIGTIESGGSSESGIVGGPVMNGYLIFDYDLIMNALLLNELEILNEAALEVVKRYHTQIPEYVFEEDAKKIYKLADFQEAVKEKRINKKVYLSFKEYIQTAEPENYNGPSNVKYVLEDGKLGSVISFRSTQGDVAPEFTGTKAKEGEDFVLNLSDKSSDYLDKITALYLDGDGLPLRADDYQLEYKIDKQQKTITIYKRAFHSGRNLYIGEHTLKIIAKDYRDLNVSLVVEKDPEPVELSLRPKTDNTEYHIEQEVMISISNEVDHIRKGDFLKNLKSITLKAPNQSTAKPVYNAQAGGTSSNDYYVINKEENYISLKPGLFKVAGEYTLYIQAEGYGVQKVSFTIAENTSQGNTDTQDNMVEDREPGIRISQVTKKKGLLDNYDTHIIEFEEETGIKLGEELKKLSSVRINGKGYPKGYNIDTYDINTPISKEVIRVRANLEDGIYDIVLEIQGKKEIRYSYTIGNASNNSGSTTGNGQDGTNPSQDTNQNGTGNSQTPGNSGNPGEVDNNIPDIPEEPDSGLIIEKVERRRDQYKVSFSGENINDTLNTIASIKIGNKEIEKDSSYFGLSMDKYKFEDNGYGTKIILIKTNLTSGQQITIKLEGKKAIVYTMP